ncbi:MAG: hypothetical protein GY754_23350 [bacterium]|nr:hypothetical protein [bacterium]
MRFFNKYIAVCSLFLILFPVFKAIPAAGNPQHGPIARLYYAPWGVGRYSAPYGTAATAHTATIEGNSLLETATEFKVSLGYFYDFLQAEAGYTTASVANQTIAGDNNANNTISEKGSLNYFDIKAGWRFNDPGDSSYNWLYAGCKFLKFSTDTNNTEADATGFFAGLYGFHSWGMDWDLEFVLTYDLFAGIYTKGSSEISSTVTITDDLKTSFNPGLSFGIGLQYEPYNISGILKTAAEWNYLRHISESNYIGAGLLTITVGFEIVFMLPNYKYNLDD